MQPVLSSEEMRRADREAQRIGISDAVLMENAARGACDVLERIARESERRNPVVAVFCGMGNNGGDGVAIVRHALNRRMNAIAVLVGERTKASQLLRAQVAIVEHLDPSSIVSFESYRRRRVRPDIAVDALLGTGSTGQPRPPVSSAIRWITAHCAQILAIDIPSGIDATTGAAAEPVISAQWTATMGALKLGLTMGRGRDCAGEVSVVDIGAPRAIYHNGKNWMLDRDAATARLPTIQNSRHKYDRGKVLVVGASKGMVGAGILSSVAALRSGAGLAVLAAPAQAIAGSSASIPAEIMVRHCGETALEAEALLDLLLSDEQFDAVVCGPGLGRGTGIDRGIRLLLAECQVPLVLDADGLLPFAGAPQRLRNRVCPLIITPHHGEMAHLLGTPRDVVSSEPCGIAIAAAKKIQGTVVLKGAPTVIASPDGTVWINGAGNPGMATAGAGDVLAGTLGALVARRSDVFDAVLAGVYLHSSAADMAAARIGMSGMTAGDILAMLPESARVLYKNR